MYLQTCLLSLNIVINKHLKYIPSCSDVVVSQKTLINRTNSGFQKSFSKIKKRNFNSPLLLGNASSLDLLFHISPFDLVPLEAF